MIVKKCLICNIEFRIKPYMKNRAKFCSLICYGMSIRGKIGWNRGLKLSEGHKEKLRQAKLKNPVRYWLGKKFSQEHIKNNAQAHKGHKPPKSAFKKGYKPWNYKGDKSLSLLQKLRATNEYRQWRKLVLERDNYACIWCGKKELIQTDHIKSFSKYPELRFSPDNGRTLCKSCHILTETYGARARYL